MEVEEVGRGRGGRCGVVWYGVERSDTLSLQRDVVPFCSMRFLLLFVSCSAVSVLSLSCLVIEL